MIVALEDKLLRAYLNAEMFSQSIKASFKLRDRTIAVDNKNCL